MDEREARKMQVRNKLEQVRDNYENALTIDKGRI